MSIQELGNAHLMVSSLVFIAVILVVEGVYIIWRSQRGTEARRVQQRLDLLAGTHQDETQRILKQAKLSDLSALERLLGNMQVAHKLQRFLAQAGLSWTVARLALSSLAAALLVFTALAFAHQPLSIRTLVAVAVGALPLAYVTRLRHQRLRKLGQQLPEALELITRALRAGHAFTSGLQMLSEEMSEPIAGEFRIVHEQVKFGLSLQQALNNLCERVPLTDLRYFVVAVMIQRQSGGNLTEVLGNLSKLIRERLKLLGRVKVLSSEGRLSAWVLAVLPFAIGALLNLVNPEFMSPLWTDPIGIAIVKTLVVMMVLGILILVKIIKIRV
jgi:tight adherence protein B